MLNKKLLIGLIMLPTCAVFTEYNTSNTPPLHVIIRLPANSVAVCSSPKNSNEEDAILNAQACVSPASQRDSDTDVSRECALDVSSPNKVAVMQREEEPKPLNDTSFQATDEIQQKVQSLEAQLATQTALAESRQKELSAEQDKHEIQAELSDSCFQVIAGLEERNERLKAETAQLKSKLDASQSVSLADTNVSALSENATVETRARLKTAQEVKMTVYRISLSLRRNFDTYSVQECINLLHKVRDQLSEIK